MPGLLCAFVNGEVYSSRALARWTVFFTALGLEVTTHPGFLVVAGHRVFTREGWAGAEEASLNGEKTLFILGDPVPGGYCVVNVGDFLQKNSGPECRFQIVNGWLEVSTLSGCVFSRIALVPEHCNGLHDAYVAARILKFSEKVLPEW